MVDAIISGTRGSKKINYQVLQGVLNEDVDRDDIVYNYEPTVPLVPLKTSSVQFDPKTIKQKGVAIVTSASSVLGKQTKLSEKTSTEEVEVDENADNEEWDEHEQEELLHEDDYYQNDYDDDDDYQEY
jgi:hypothetical protein